jgi:hypothetical protein
MRTEELMAKLQAKYPTEKEYLQAVREVLECIEDVVRAAHAATAIKMILFISIKFFVFFKSMPVF